MRRYRRFTVDEGTPIVQRRRGRRRFDLPPNVTKVLIAWAVGGPALVAALFAVRS